MLSKQKTREAVSLTNVLLTVGLALVFLAFTTATAFGHVPEIALEFDGSGAHVATGLTAGELGVAGNAPRKGPNSLRLSTASSLSLTQKRP